MAEAEINCYVCKEKIGEEEYVNLETKFFHLAHFCCKKCNTQLGGKIYFEHDDDFFCEDDYQALFMTSCTNCGQVIKDQYLQVLGKNYHQDCFVCKGCKTKFQDDHYLNFDNDPYCQDCGKNKAKICGGCQQPILEKLYSALDKFWHIDCFKCSKCNKGFQDGGFVPVDGKPYHQKCFLVHCAVCQKICDKEYYQVENNQAVHEECIETYKKNKQKILDQMRIAQESIKNIQEKPQEAPKEQPKKEEPKKEEAKVEEVVVPVLKKPQEEKLEEGIKSIKLNENKFIFPYESLINPPFPKGVDPSRREEYLSNEDFTKLFKMGVAEFKNLPKWKQGDLKKKLKLF